MDDLLPFDGQALNAVDGKGRVSLPSHLRDAIVRRAKAAQESGLPVDDKLLYIAEDEELPCLVGHDEVEHLLLSRELREKRREETSDRKSLVRRGRGAATFAPMQRVVFDKAGRMVLNSLLRDITGIANFAFFAGNGDSFDIWDPVKAHAHYSATADHRMVRILEYMCADKGLKL